MSSAKMSIYISKMRHLFLNELYFGFFQTFKDSIKYKKFIYYTYIYITCIYKHIYSI